MTNLFLAPVTDRKGAYGHFRKTMLNGIPDEEYSKFNDNELGSYAYVWGLSSTFTTTWENADENDWVLFYSKENQYEYAAQIKTKEHDPAFGDAIREHILEDVSGNRNWDYLLLFDEPIKISISGDKMAELLEYDIRYPVRFMRVANDQIKRVESKYNNVDEFISSIRE